MRELFEAIDNCEAGSVNMVLTVLGWRISGREGTGIRRKADLGE